MLFRTLSTLSNKSFKDEESFHAAKYVPRLLQDFVLGESLGKGGFGEIIKATHKYDENQVAIKIIRYESDADSLKKACKEANILATLSHPNIVRYFNSWAETAKVPLVEYKKSSLGSDTGESISSEIKKLNQDGYMSKKEYDEEDDDDEDQEYEEAEEKGEADDDSISFRSESKEIKELNYLFIQMELCDKRTLRNAIDNNLFQEEAKLTKYFGEICEGLCYIHQKNIVHRDLKPENIFLTCGDVIKIGDFGLSKQIPLRNGLDVFEEDNQSDLACASLTAPCGTSIYIAPEFFIRAYCNVKADIYSLGVTYFEMCSQPMTQMEKSKLFPLTSDRINAMVFLTNKKKSLLKSLLHPIDRVRPNCEQILEMIKSEKTIEEVRAMIQRNQKVPREQFMIFNKELKSNKIRRLDKTQFFVTTAVKVFELHCGRNIPMPTFLPSLNNFPDNLTTLLNTSGNSMSIANTSRLAFSYHVARHKIRQIRRYSTEKVFKEGQFWPSEFQECLFEAVSPELEDYVLDAEMLFIGHEICEKIFVHDVLQHVRIVLNHHLIFASVLKHCRISDDLADLFTNCVLNSPEKLPFLVKTFCRFHFSHEVEVFLLKMFNGFRIQDAEEKIRSLMNSNRGSDFFAGVNRKWLKTAFNQIDNVVSNAEKFGIRSENIVLHPLFINERHSKDIMFKITYGYVYNTILATGGRFNSMIKRCGGYREKEHDYSSCEISFNVGNVVKLLNQDKCVRVVDVVLVAEDKSMAVPLFKDLLSQNIKCEIVRKLLLSNRSNGQPLIVIQLDVEDYGIVYKLEKSGSRCILTEVFRGNIQSVNVNNYLKPRNIPRRRPQIAWSSTFDV